jgi:hypothetical protein
MERAPSEGRRPVSDGGEMLRRGERRRSSFQAARTPKKGIVEAPSRYTPPSTRAIALGEAAAFVH